MGLRVMPQDVQVFRAAGQHALNHKTFLSGLTVEA